MIALVTAPVSKKSADLLGDLKGHVLLRLVCAGAEMRRADDLLHAEKRAVLWRARFRNTSSAAPATWPLVMASANAASSIRPPRAQLMIRTPLFGFCEIITRQYVAGAESVSGV